jgi:uncharacterized protein DUF2752
MRVVFKKRAAGQIEFGLIYGGIALLALFAAGFLPVLSISPSCVLKGVTNIPCPTCGSTRALVFLAHGEFIAALAMNPLIVLCLLASALIFPTSLITYAFGLPRISLILSEQEGNIVRYGAIGLVFAQWCYLIFTLP